MSASKAYEPTPEELDLARRAFEIELVSFQREAEKLEPTDFLRRYHRIRLKICCVTQCEVSPLFVTVRRLGSKLGAENFYTVPLLADPLSMGAEASYELLSFDSFNLPFESILIEMCRPEDYVQRRISANHIERAQKFATRIKE